MGCGGEGKEETASLKCEKNEVEHSCEKPYQIPHRGLMIEAGNLAIPSVHLLD